MRRWPVMSMIPLLAPTKQLHGTGSRAFWRRPALAAFSKQRWMRRRAQTDDWRSALDSKVLGTEVLTEKNWETACRAHSICSGSYVVNRRKEEGMGI